MNEWISVKDRLPELLQDVLLYEEGDIYISHLYDYNLAQRKTAKKKEKYPEQIQWYEGCCCSQRWITNPTHWMPLPNSPKE